MILAATLLASLPLNTAPARADGVLSSDAPCGGDAYSSAQVIERRPPRRGPVTAVPDTLCADLAPQHPPQHPPAGLAIPVYPLVVPENGARHMRAPY